MSEYRALAKIFEDRTEDIIFYETRAILKLKNELYFTLLNESKQLLFLIGEPGCGKSVFLNQLPNFYKEEFSIIKFDTPFFEPVDFIRTLIKKRRKSVGRYSLEEMIKEAVKLYEKGDTIIAIDEAQLLSKEMVELLRILADTKAFWFLLAMHRHESQKILREPQFSSRPHRVFTFDAMDFGEVREFISKELLRTGSFAIEKQMDKRVVKEIYNFTKGNFRDTKKLLNRTFLLLDYATKIGKRYDGPNSCVITMAAIDGGLLDI